VAKVATAGKVAKNIPKKAPAKKTQKKVANGK
jgi:hypothetical protein